MPHLSITDSSHYSNETVNVVVVDSVTVPKGGFIAVFNQGNRIGTSEFLTAGSHTNVQIELSQPVTKGTTLISILYNDANSNEKFETDWDVRYYTNDEPVSEATQITFIEPPPEPQEDNSVPSSNKDSDDLIDLGVVLALGTLPLLICVIFGSYLYKRYRIENMRDE
jgi:hypothetical protein